MAYAERVRNSKQWQHTFLPHPGPDQLTRGNRNCESGNAQHQDGLVHISHLSDKFIKDPKEAVTVQQKVNVTVVEVDVPRKRIGLSMKSDPFGQPEPQQRSGPRKQSRPKEKEKEVSMEEKLAMLVNKFKK